MRFYTWSSEEEEDENTNEETRQNASRGRGRSDPVAGEPWRRRAKRPNTSRALQSSRAEVGTGETRLVPRGSCNHQKKAENGEVQRTTHALVRERLDVSVTRVCLTRYEQYCRAKKRVSSYNSWWYTTNLGSGFLVVADRLVARAGRAPRRLPRSVLKNGGGGGYPIRRAS